MSKKSTLCGIMALFMLFTGEKISQLALLPQGKIEAKTRARNMVATMDALGFGSCTNTYACEAECPKAISITHIARMNRDFFGAKICGGKVNNTFIE